MGTVRPDGRKVTVAGGDFTIRGGAGDAEQSLVSEWSWIYRHALDHRLPHIRLLDSAGGSVKTFEKIGRTYVSQTDGMSAMSSVGSQIRAMAVMARCRMPPDSW
jgi:acetyl-CoA carboxylase carboxyltransferase component